MWAFIFELILISVITVDILDGIFLFFLSPLSSPVSLNVDVTFCAKYISF